MARLDENKRQQLRSLSGLTLGGFGPAIDAKAAAQTAVNVSKALAKR